MPIFFVEANIGAGKSTLLGNLSKHKFAFDHVVLQEPVSIWQEMVDENGVSLFEKYYNDKKRYAFLFQIYVLSTRAKILLKAIEEHKDKVIFCERSLLSDMRIFIRYMHETNTIEKVEFDVFQDLYELVLTELKVPIDGMIYLRADPDICVDRIIERGRPGEEVIDGVFIHKLHELHEDWLNTEGNVPILVLDANAQDKTWGDGIGRIGQFVERGSTPFEPRVNGK